MSRLFLGGEVDLVGVGGARLVRLLAGAGVGRAGAAGARRASDGGVLSGGPVAVALAGGTGVARAAGASDLVLRGGLVAAAVEGLLLAARALGLLGCVERQCVSLYSTKWSFVCWFEWIMTYHRRSFRRWPCRSR